MDWIIKNANNDLAKDGVINPTVYEFDLASGTGNDDEFFFKFFNKIGNNAVEDESPLMNLDWEEIGYDYAFDHSASKKISQMVLNFWNYDRGLPLHNNVIALDENATIEDTAQRLAQRFYQRYIPSLEKIYGALFSEYNPIENYRMEEKENVGSKITVTTDNANNVFGFDSSSQGVPSNKQSGTSISSGNKNDNERVLTRAGNIGVTTSQQMIESELRLRRNRMIDAIFECVDEFITTGTYK